MDSMRCSSMVAQLDLAENERFVLTLTPVDNEKSPLGAFAGIPSCHLQSYKLTYYRDDLLH